jgi:SAM-dependent methyltransferase
LKDDTIKDRGWWEEYFTHDGGWESNGGRQQTRIFAENFTTRIQLAPNTPFSILDAGCALGDAIKHFSKVYPQASIYGIDFSKTSIYRCKNELGDIATFSVSDIGEIEEHYDIIYCSNTLEHFSDFEDKARDLALHCNRLCILVPFNELNDGKPLIPCVQQHHQHTFKLDSFDFLVQEDLSQEIKTHVFSCPGTWGWKLSTRIRQGLKNIVRVIFKKPTVSSPRQILYDIIVTSE